MTEASSGTFRYYDREGLDAQYNLAATVSDIKAVIARYEQLSGEARASLACSLGVPYGSSGDETLDIFPTATAAAPVLVFYHGGFWRSQSARTSAFMAGPLVSAGVCVVVVDFGLAPATGLDQLVRQCRGATAWVQRNIATYGGDPARIHICGSSAGAHLAAMVGAANWGGDEPLRAGYPSSLILLSGIYDLEALRHTFVNDWLGLDEPAARRNSPIGALPRSATPILAGYGETETFEMVRQSEAYMAAAAAIGCKVRYVAEPGTNHFDYTLKLAEPGSALTEAVVAQIRSA